MSMLALVVLAAAIVMRMMRRPASEIIAMSASFPAGVALTIGGEGIPLFYAAVIVALAGVFIGQVRRTENLPEPRRNRPGYGALVFFFMWCVLVTALGPAIFAGTPVLTPRAGIDESLAAPGQLTHTISNAAQLIYLALGIGLVLVFSRQRNVSPIAIGIPLAVMTLLSFARLVSLTTGLPWPEGFFDNAQNRDFIEATADGGIRFRGIFAEPSTLATYSIVTVVYYWKSLRLFGRKGRILGIGTIVCAAVNAAVSTAGTTVVAGALVFALVAITALAGWTRPGARMPPWLVIGGCFTFAATVFLIPRVLEAGLSVVVEKMASGSFESRTGADAFSFGILVDTLGFGVGLGSSRPSSFFPMLLSCVGVVGTVAFVVAVSRMASAAWKSASEIRPTVWALIALFVCKSVAGPNLSDPMIWLCLGLIAAYAWGGRRDGDPSDLTIEPTSIPLPAGSTGR